MIRTAGTIWPRRQLRGLSPFLPPARHVDDRRQRDRPGGENCLADAQGRARQARQLDQQARGQRIGEEGQGFYGPAGQHLVPQDLIEIEGDGHESQPEQGARRASERGGEVVPLFRVVRHRGSPHHWFPKYWQRGQRGTRAGCPRGPHAVPAAIVFRAVLLHGSLVGRGRLPARRSSTSGGCAGRRGCHR